MKRQPKLLEETNHTPGAKCVGLEFVHPAARKVFIAGTFNDWQPAAMPMNALGDGEWRVDLELFPGRYEYRFVADGQWLNGAAAELVPNPFGSENSVLVVETGAGVSPRSAAK